jgi:hypothetical protein
MNIAPTAEFDNGRWNICYIQRASRCALIDGADAYISTPPALHPCTRRLMIDRGWTVDNPRPH